MTVSHETRGKEYLRTNNIKAGVWSRINQSYTFTGYKSDRTIQETLFKSYVNQV